MASLSLNQLDVELAELRAAGEKWRHGDGSHDDEDHGNWADGDSVPEKLAKASHKTIKNETQDDAKAVFESLIQQRRAGRGTTANMSAVESAGQTYRNVPTIVDGEFVYPEIEDTFTLDQIDGLNAYAGNDAYRDMNDALRSADGEWPDTGELPPIGDPTLTPEQEEFIRTWEANYNLADAIDEHGQSWEFEQYRGQNGGFLGSGELNEGDVFSDDGFGSWSADPSISEGFAIRHGERGRDGAFFIMKGGYENGKAIAGAVKESELIYSPGTHYKVTEIVDVTWSGQDIWKLPEPDAAVVEVWGDYAYDTVALPPGSPQPSDAIELIKTTPDGEYRLIEVEIVPPGTDADVIAVPEEES